MSRRRSTPKLTPVWLPWIRSKLAERLRGRLSGQSRLLQATPYQRMLSEAWNEADSLAAAPLWWVSRDMTTLAVDTAQAGGLPDTDPPSPAGFICFDGSLPLELPDGMPPIAAVHWIIDGSRPGPEGRSWLIRPLLYTDDHDACAKEGGLPLAPISQAPTAGLPQALGDILLAVWALSQEPRICQAKPAQPSTADRLPASLQPEAKKVKMLVLRENLNRPGQPAEPGEDPRAWTHRWIVRGFWRNQAYGPDHALRRRQWIPPYVKGPADKPLIAKETVRIWRR
ncbi:MAG: hypothetical protein M3036_00885 [Bifidobacteriales bacterium]|nr:hypothetical protein [Bifidobacteriales bacterium]